MAEKPAVNLDAMTVEDLTALRDAVEAKRGGDGQTIERARSQGRGTAARKPA